MEGNIIGEPIEGFVQEQIGLRQVSQFAGFENSRDSFQLQYLSNRNAWVKFASSVKIESNTAGQKKLEKLGIESPSNYLGTGLAEAAILFNTLSKYTPNPDQQAQPGGTLNSNRSGVFNTFSLEGKEGSTAPLWNDSFAYGIGVKNYGLQPPPGIIGVTVDSLNRGSIRKANITLKAHNRFQFDIIELLYLRLGFTMMLEWGWDKYLGFYGDTENDVALFDVGNTIIEDTWFNSNGVSQIGMVNAIDNYRVKYSGNYDGFFGKVSNFTWNFNPDGTYDISIDLITIGDVIESLKVNTSSKILGLPTGSSTPNPTTTPQEEDTNIVKASYLNTVGYFLYLKTKEISVNFEENNLQLRGTVSGSIINDGVNNYYIINPSKARPDINTTTQGKQSNQYYIRLKEFFAQLETLVIPLIDGDNQLQFELDSCYMSHFPNQISFDPKVCIFKFPINYGDIPTVKEGYGEGIYNPAIEGEYMTSNYLQYLGDCSAKIGDYNYLNLMNIYVNFEFISGLLLQNGGPDQTISLFKFLQDLCNGINNALGGVNKLEPVIKNDYIITIIDQTFSSASTKNVIELEVNGYNNVLKTSNFVKDIKFVSKITPQLASMISIGATAAGSSVANLDGTAFSKWSEGLTDRFSTEISEPSGVGSLEELRATQQSQEEIDKYRAEWLKFPSSGNTTNKRISNFAGGVGFALRTFFGNFAGGIVGFGTATSATIKAIPIASKQTELNNKELDKIEKRIIGAPYQKFLNQSMTFDEFLPKAQAYTQWLKSNKVYTLEEMQNLVSTNYLIYLLNAFGGFTKQYKIPYVSNRVNDTLVSNYSIDSSRSRYLEFNDSFIAQGKAVYQNYLNDLNARRFKSINVPSTEVGFIPLSFEVILDGISGIKIYNKLDINNTFLPSNYPQSLKFIITKVNHNISNNSWDTSLSTISIPETQPYIFGEFVTPQALFDPSESGEAATGGDFSSGDLFTYNQTTTNSWKLLPDPSISNVYVGVPVENGFLHRYPGMLVEADSSLYARLNLQNTSDNRKFRLFKPAMPHFINLLNAYEKAVSSDGKTFLQKYGKLTINSAYRAIQNTPGGSAAAKPGTSRHGLGIAVDLQQPASYNEVHEWFKANAPGLGWMRIAVFNGINETWHWELQYEGPYAKIDKNVYATPSNIKNNGRNGAIQYVSSNYKGAKGVDDISSSYLIDSTGNVWGKQIAAQILPSI